MSISATAWSVRAHDARNAVYRLYLIRAAGPPVTPALPGRWLAPAPVCSPSPIAAFRPAADLTAASSGRAP
jgi:hypothetical protein